MMKALKGFTLAEVLTTLMVIGVVAAMTIPTLMNSTTDQQLKVAYKKAMSVLGQGVQLMVAKETECKVVDNQSLAECFANNVLSGTVLDGSQKNGARSATAGANNTVVTSDGIAYQFWFNGTPLTVADTFDNICGEMGDLLDSNGQPTEGTYNGSSAKCLVLVDVNGLSKGAKMFANNGKKTWSEAVGSSGIDDTALYGSGGTNALGGTEQQPIILTGTGVKPAYNTKSATSTANKGYGWMYGNTTNPWTDTST